MKMDISQTLSDLYEWNEKANVSSQGKQYLLFKTISILKKYLIYVSKLYYSKIIKPSTPSWDWKMGWYTIKWAKM